MRIAVPCEDDKGLESRVAAHFGRAPYFAVITVEGKRVKDVKIVETPAGGHAPGEIPGMLRGMGVEAVLAYGMGRRAMEFFKTYGIRVTTGASGRVGDVVKDFLEGRLKVDERWIEGEEFKEGRRHLRE